jgi:molybdate transport system regulatory protein
MKISARNILPGTITRITGGAINSEVELTIGQDEKIVTIITNTSVALLGLVEGGHASAIIKANEVILGKDLGEAKLSARNILSGTVEAVIEGAVNSEVTLALASGAKIVSTITRQSVVNLGLVAGSVASAIIKSSNILIGVE